MRFGRTCPIRSGSNSMIRRTRSHLHMWLCAAFVLTATAVAAVQAPLISGVDSVNITVSDIDRAARFYSGVLNFHEVAEAEISGEAYEHLEGLASAHARVLRLQLGDEFIELTQYRTPAGRAIPSDARSNDQSFQHIAIIVSDMDRAYALLRRNNVEAVSSGPQRLPDWNKNAAGIRAFYFKDPDGHPVEILQFPLGKGLEKWHRTTARLFLGIDHTAIVVRDTDRSLRFYCDLLGMRVAGESDNYGVEQEHLNNVPGAHLRITSLRGATGPGIELLEYLSPKNGQTFPPDEHANDLVHRETVVITADAHSAARKISNSRASFVSSGVVSESDGQSGFSKAFLVRDPDGHPVLVEQK